MDTLLRVLEVALVPIIVAAITSTAGIVAVLRLRRENTEQHSENKDLLKHLSGQVTNIDSKVDTISDRVAVRFDRVDERLDDMAMWRASHEVQHLIQSTRDRDKSA